MISRLSILIFAGLICSCSSSVLNQSVKINETVLKLENSNPASSYEVLYHSTYSLFKTIQDKLTKGLLGSLQLADLDLLYRSTFETAFYSKLITQDHSAADANFLILDEMFDRGTSDQNKETQSFQLAIEIGNRLAAKHILKRSLYLSETEVPLIVGELKSNGMYYYTLNKTHFSTTKFNFKLGPQIILVAGCHFALDAIKVLSASINFVKVMKTYGLTLAPPDAVLDAAAINENAQLYPEFVLHPVANAPAWWFQGIHTDVLPTFYFISDGKIKFQFSGSENVIENFCTGLNSIGLEQVKGCPHKRAE